MTTRAQRPADVLLLAAHPLELEPLTGTLGASLRARLHDLEIAAAAVGVGLIAAGGGTARALSEHSPLSAVLLGSYGVYPGRGSFEPAQLFVPSRLRAIDGAERAGRAAFPEAMPVEIEAAGVLCAALAGDDAAIERGTLATTLAITTDDALARELGAHAGCHGENLEAAAVAYACRSARVSFAAVLACTNEVGSQGRAQWLEHRAAAAHATARLVLSWLSRGAPGGSPQGPAAQRA
jgi:nucleoside phosphorylase